MINKTIGQHMKDVLLEQGITHVWYGNPDQIHDTARRSGMYEKGSKDHPLHIIQKVLNALDRCEDFQKSYIRHENRFYRCYSVKE